LRGIKLSLKVGRLENKQNDITANYCGALRNLNRLLMLAGGAFEGIEETFADSS
jgi:hypothetical protein